MVTSRPVSAPLTGALPLSGLLPWLPPYYSRADALAAEAEAIDTERPVFNILKPKRRVTRSANDKPKPRVRAAANVAEHEKPLMSWKLFLR